MVEDIDRRAVDKDDEIAPLARAVGLRPLNVVIREQTRVPLKALHHLPFDDVDRLMIDVKGLPEEPNTDGRCGRTKCRPIRHNEPVLRACVVFPMPLGPTTCGMRHQARMQARKDLEVGVRQRGLGEWTLRITGPRRELGGGGCHAAEDNAVNRARTPAAEDD